MDLLRWRSLSDRPGIDSRRGQGSNAFAAWEKKIYVLVCGGPMASVEIHQVPLVAL